MMPRASNLPATPDAIELASHALLDGGVVAYPTDTLYGLAVDPRNAGAVRRLFDIKGRDRASAIPLIAASLEQAQEAGRFSDTHLRLARAWWPGPLTLVVPALPGIVPDLIGGGSTVAIRVPAHPLAVALADDSGFCLTSTSANLSRQPPATTAAEVMRDLGDVIDIVLDGGPSPGGPPSTIVEVAPDGPRLIRAGAVPWERVLESLQ
jgi:L-threonylcarbamoyladenylate synthase